MGGPLAVWAGRKPFFFEKKNQKTFATWRALPERGATAVQKFFGSFFQKRTTSSLMPRGDDHGEFVWIS
jgi:hypothetical protein